MDDTETKPPETEPKDKDAVELLIEQLENNAIDLELEEHKFKVRNKDKTITEYTLRELDAPQRTEYMDFQNTKAKFTDGKFSGMRNVKGLESKLLSLSIHSAAGLVPEQVINTWPGKLIRNLAMIARRISGLDEQAETKAKND